MYDVKSEAREFIGETAADARAKAVRFFGIDESEITFSELGAGGVSGVGARTVVVAQPTETVGRVADGGRNRGNEREPRGRERGPARERGGRSRSERDREPGGRGRGERDRERGGRGRGERDRERGAARSEPDREGARVADQPSVGTAKGDLGPVGQFVLGLIERMDIGPFQLGESEDGRFTVYELSGPAAEELTSGESRAIEAVQLLANQAAGRLTDEPKRIVVDAEGDREMREDFLARMAERAARRAADSGRAVALDPMNGRDRRGIHMALREMEGIATMSIGEGRYRQVVVVPEGAPEYEEALESAREGSSTPQQD